MNLRVRNRLRSAFTLVELLVVIAIVGVLIALLLPAVQMAREAARRVQCQNNLRQLALAVEMFHDTNQAYPPARYEPRPDELGIPERATGGVEATWMVRILPYLEQTSTYGLWDVNGPWYETPTAALELVPPSFLCPTRRSAGAGLGTRAVGGNSGGTLPCGCPIPSGDGSGLLVRAALSDYAGNHGDLSSGSAGLSTDFYYGGNGTGILISSRAYGRDGRPFDWFDRVTHASVVDGLSHTWLVGEKHIPVLEIGRFPYDSPVWDGDHLSASARVGGLGMGLGQGPGDSQSTYFAFGSWHPSITHFAMADGSVQSLRNNTSTFVLSQLAHRSDRTPVNGE